MSGKAVFSPELSEEEVLAAGFLERFGQTCQAASQLVRFLYHALELPFG